MYLKIEPDMNYLKIKKIIFIIYFIFLLCSTGCEQSIKSTDFLNKRYAFDESPESKLIKFQLDFERSLSYGVKNIAHIYVHGLMGHISYTDSLPSFVAFVKLHHGLNILMETLRDEKIQKSFKERFQIFSSFLKKNPGCDIDSYCKRLNSAYSDFLVEFINIYHDFFLTRFTKNVKLGGTMDIVDRSFFALQKKWPSYESYEQKYQFESLTSYPCHDGRILILGYNDHLEATDHTLHIYIWDPRHNEIPPIQITQLNMNFDLSPAPRAGGYDTLVSLKDIVSFDGRYLTFYGYDYMVYRHYTYDVVKNQFKITAR